MRRNKTWCSRRNVVLGILVTILMYCILSAWLLLRAIHTHQLVQSHDNKALLLTRKDTFSGSPQHKFVLLDDSPNKLTHIVMPFFEGQLDAVLENFVTWETYPPCIEHQSVVDLIFFLSRDENIISLRTTLLSRVNESSWAKKCFRRVEVVSANMTAAEDNYWLGSRVQFEKFLSFQFLSHPSVVQYVMYMEPDCYVFRPDWLSLLQRTALEEEFMIKGHRSMPRFNLTYDHINGNALYNLGDGRLTDFYFNIYGPRLRPHEEAEGATGVWHLAYDMDIHKFLDYFSANKDNHEVVFLRDKVVSSEFIQNYFHLNYSVVEVMAEYPSSFMVHGGYRHED